MVAVIMVNIENIYSCKNMSQQLLNSHAGYFEKHFPS